MKRIKGFTLIEMLVVVAIITVLVSLLMPALQRSVNSARQIDCQNRIRQCFLAFSSYADDNFGIAFKRQAQSGGYMTWNKQLMNQGYIDKAIGTVTLCPSQPTNKYVSSTRCDTVAYGLNINTDVAEIEIGSNAWVASFYQRMNSIPSPSMLLLFSDSIVWNTSSYYPDGYCYFRPYAANFQSRGSLFLRHVGGANTVFADGHSTFYSNPMDLVEFNIKYVTLYDYVEIRLY